MRWAPAALAFAGADGEVVLEAEPIGLEVVSRPGSALTELEGSISSTKGTLVAAEVKTKELFLPDGSTDGVTEAALFILAVSRVIVMPRLLRRTALGADLIGISG